MPLLVRWPGRLRAGSESDQPCITMDLTASILRIANADQGRRYPLDGLDVLALVQQRKPPQPRTLFWRARRGTKTWRAVRDGNLKYVELAGVEGAGSWLYDLDADIGEQHDLLQARAEDARRLRARLAAWEVAVQPTR